MSNDKKLEAKLLRQKAVDIFESRPLKSAEDLAETDVLKLYHELSVHQIELELRNEELIEAKENAAKLADEKYVELYDFAPSGYLTLSEEGEIITLNLCAAKMLGKERSHLKNNAFGFLVSNETSHLFDLFLGKIFNTKSIETCELSLAGKGILVSHVLLNGMITENGKRCLVTMVDISEFKKKEAQLEFLHAEKDKLFSIIAHDLKNPLSGFLGVTEIISKRLHLMKYNEILDITFIMRNTATKLFHLLENLLEWSSMQSGLISFTPTSILLVPQIYERLETVIQSAYNKEINISFNIPDDLTVCADEYMLNCILRNLISNAVKFTPRGGSISVSAYSISENEVQFSVKDTGIGMDQQFISNLLRLNSATKRNGTEGEASTGLGLIICRDFIEKHESKLIVESEKGIGSYFYFTLPKKCKEILA